ncbi:Na+/H+ antiporter [Phenylobacterium zucineum HLK1]|uniref:Na(+)/H(+) antiporter NhaA n=1 Tax=Phenylobacterium zucineum (strain HLK1) TaxID=450851 RepID=B4R8D3_PHEZH|nr:Na+/H+ antiporter NhaA [Phenylobacterium zucineum]ACG79251.1 Na+/H+ antiporter [Phenylobacterium zucineum HLK1]
MSSAERPQRRTSAFREFFNQEASGGYVLMAAAAVALVIANSPLAGPYFAVLETKLGFALGPLALNETVLHWINDGLMALFFLLVGLEIKREVLDGELSRPSRVVLPGLAALGGVAVPALIYAALNMGDPEASRGWAIPAATDIAFALGILALAGDRVPASLKIFLTALAVLDDLAAILIIAVFYTADLHLGALGGAGAALALLVAMNRLKVRRLWPYLLTGLVLWWFVLESGVHATLAGVALAMTIPLDRTPARPDAHSHRTSPAHRLEHLLHKPVAFAVVPIFGFANAGLPLAGITFEMLTDTVMLGIALGLFIGKQIGVFLTALLVIRLGWSDMPRHASLGQLYAVSVLCGVGFTMSLFVGNLAFTTPDLLTETKAGVFAGSLVSAVLGLVLLKIFRPEPPPARAEGGDAAP